MLSRYLSLYFKKIVTVMIMITLNKMRSLLYNNIHRSINFDLILDVWLMFNKLLFQPWPDFIKKWRLHLYATIVVVWFIRKMAILNSRYGESVPNKLN